MTRWLLTLALASLLGCGNDGGAPGMADASADAAASDSGTPGPDAGLPDARTPCGECSPAEVETENTARCGRRHRTCNAVCEWGEWRIDVEDGECMPGETRRLAEECVVAEELVQECTEECIWTEGTCESLCPGARRTTPWDAEELCIPAGEFVRGDETFDDAVPVRNVSVSAYYIDRFPVSNRRYAVCIDAGACSTPEHASGVDSLSDTTRGDYPVQGLTWLQAEAFCEWDGRRLPTEAEWEKAGRGPAPGSTAYPWGDEYSCAHLDIPPCGGAGLRSDGLISDPIDGLPTTASYYGVEMLLGGGEEWVGDWYLYNYYSDDASLTDPSGPSVGSSRGVRGQPRSRPAGYHIFRLARRWYEDDDAANLYSTMRCARSAE